MAKSKAQHRISPPKNKKPGLGGRLTIKQKRFVEAYIKNGGNGTRAVIEAGYRVASESSAQVIASQYLKKPIIALALEKAGYEDCGIINVDEIERARAHQGGVQRIASREDRAAFLTSVIFDEYVPIMARLKTNELLGRMYGDYLQKVIIKEQQNDMPTIQFNLDNDD